MCASGAAAAEVTEERLEPSAGAAAAFAGDGPLGRHCGLDTEVDKPISSPPFLAHRVLGVGVLDGSLGVLTSRSAVVSLAGARTGADACRMNSSSSRMGPSIGAEGDGGGEEPGTPFFAWRGVADQCCLGRSGSRFLPQEQAQLSTPLKTVVWILRVWGPFPARCAALRSPRRRRGHPWLRLLAPWTPLCSQKAAGPWQKMMQDDSRFGS